MFQFVVNFTQQSGDLISSTHADFPLFTAAMLFLMGAIIASFGGVCIDRLPHQMGWIENPKENYTISTPRSSCNNCSRVLSPIDLIPILGWLVSLGRCRTCKGSVPWVYPLTEATLGLLFAASSLWFSTMGEVAAFCLLSACMFVITGLDIKHHWIPAVITTPLMWMGLLLSPFETEILLRVLGAMLGGATVSLVFWYYEKRSGVDAYSGGDVAFLALMGAWIGVFHIFNYLILAALIFSVHSGWLRWKKGVVMVPWGPHLSFAALVYIAIFF